MTKIGCIPYLNREINSPIVSTYFIPEYIKNFNFNKLADGLKLHKIILYPSPINNPRLIRIGNIGDITFEELKISLDILTNELKN